MMNLATAVTIWDDAQFISVIDTSPQACAEEVIIINPAAALAAPTYSLRNVFLPQNCNRQCAGQRAPASLHPPQYGSIQLGIQRLKAT